LTVTIGGSVAKNADIVIDLSDGTTLTCKTDPSGKCSLSAPGLSWNNVDKLTFTLRTVNGTAANPAPSTKADRP
jgi:hypothetical protein